MPNYKLGAKIVADMVNAAGIIVNRTVRQVETGFPLSFDQVQAGILPERWRTTALEMRRDGFYLHTSKTAYTSVAHDTIPRTAQLSISYKGHDLLVMSNSMYQTERLDTSILTDKEIAALAAWVNNAVRERRFAGLVTATIKDFLEKHAETTGHVLARWPALTILGDAVRDVSSPYGSTTIREGRESLRAKLADPPRSLKPYDWDARSTMWRMKHARAMQLSELVLASALMLPKDMTDEALMTASIRSWTPLPGDPDKP